jgi:integrase
MLWKPAICRIFHLSVSNGVRHGLCRKFAGWFRGGKGDMARTLRDAKLDTRNARTKLRRRKEPYWRSLAEGLAIGYYRGAKGGSWIAKHYSQAHGRRYSALGPADDVADADGVHILAFAQAQAAARKWLADLARYDAGEIETGSYTVSTALTDYVADYKRRGGKAADRLEWTIEAHIRPTLGETLVANLTRSRIETWIDGIAAKAPRARTREGEAQQYRDMPKGSEGARRRRSTANRVLTVLKAALNLAYQRRRVANREAWASVRPFREADAAKVRYLSDDDARRLVNACPTDLRALVTAALLTGCRYGGLAAITAADFDASAGTLHVARSKGGKPRHVPLTDEGHKFFSRAATNKNRGELLFTRKSGGAWGRAHQFRPLKDACAVAKIKPWIGFHVLRHTYASRLAMKGVSMAVIAAALGHADQRICEKYYAHMAPSYIHETVRAAIGNLGIVPADNVVTIASAG